MKRKTNSKAIAHDLNGKIKIEDNLREKKNNKNRLIYGLMEVAAWKRANFSEKKLQEKMCFLIESVTKIHICFFLPRLVFKKISNAS